MLRYGNWKYIRLNNGADELYDLENDIGETTNLAGSQPSVLVNLKARFDAQQTALDEPSPTWYGIPTVSKYGMVALVLLLLAFGTIVFRRRGLST